MGAAGKIKSFQKDRKANTPRGNYVVNAAQLADAVEMWATFLKRTTPVLSHLLEANHASTPNSKQRRKRSRFMGNAKSMSLGPDAAAVVTKAISSMPSPPMIETGIFAAGTSFFRVCPRGERDLRASSSMPDVVFVGGLQTNALRVRVGIRVACLRDLQQYMYSQLRFLLNFESVHCALSSRGRFLEIQHPVHVRTHTRSSRLSVRIYRPVVRLGCGYVPPLLCKLDSCSSM